MTKSVPSPLDRVFLTNNPDAGTLLLIRHGQQQWPDPETSSVGDWVNPPLSDLGQQQARAVGRYLSSVPISAVYSSQLLRANHTGEAIAQHHGHDVTVIKELEEIMLYGKVDPEKRAVDELGEHIVRGARERFAQTRSWDSYPQSESSLAFRNRVGLAVEAVVSGHPGETVAVACHGGVINAYLAEMLQLDADMFFRPAHASVHRIQFNESVRAIHSLNETHFLEAEDLLSS